MSTFLIAGAAGFIGARVSELLMAKGDRVVGVDNLNDAYDPKLKDWRLARLQQQNAFEFHQADILDSEALAELASHGPYTAVINLAARAGVRLSVRQPEVYANTNLIGAIHLLEFARTHAVPKFILASTSSLYGLSKERPFRETESIGQPLSPYAASKGAAEMMAHAYHHLHGMDISVLRYFTVYGPAGRPDMSIFRFIQWIAEGKPLRLFGDGSQERDYTYVDDIARGTIAALAPAGFEIFNLGGDRPVSIMDVIRLIESALDKQANIEQLDSAPGDVPATWADISKAQAVLGWRPEVDLEEGLGRTVAWYLEERAWASQVDTSDS